MCDKKMKALETEWRCGNRHKWRKKVRRYGAHKYFTQLVQNKTTSAYQFNAQYAFYYGLSQLLHTRHIDSIALDWYSGATTAFRHGVERHGVRKFFRSYAYEVHVNIAWTRVYTMEKLKGMWLTYYCSKGAGK